MLNSIKVKQNIDRSIIMSSVKIFRNFKILLIILIIIFMCSACSNERIEYEGNYISNDESTLSITATSGSYKIVIEITNLTLIDDGIGTLDIERDIMSFVATDASGNPIGGELQWNDSDDVVLKFTNSTWDYLPNGTELSFKRNNNESVNDYEEHEDNTYDENVLPYAEASSSYLGNSYSKFKAKGNVKYEVPVSGDFLTFIKDTAEDGIDYSIIDEQTYIGVQGDTIVGFAQYGYPSDLLVNDWIQQDGFYDNPPKIVESGNFVLLGWQISNGYLIVSAYPTNNNGEWYNYRPGWIIHINSLEQCNIEW